MLCLIVLLSTLTTLTTCQTGIATQSLFDKEERSNIPQDILDKAIGTKDNKLSDNYDLPQQFSSSKERPELNPVLSALINEDIKKNIEAKRQTESDADQYKPTTFKPILTTTDNSLSSAARMVNDGLVDQSISLDEAGSENKQTSRIQIKKGPNGVDYEYEYVYYYYDDDEKDTKKKPSLDDDKPLPISSTSEQPSRGSNKSRYTTLDRSTVTSTVGVAEQNEVVSRGGKQRTSIPVVEEISEERLPLNTRFPPRSIGSSNITPPIFINSEETTKKISVKRPSIALVDSQSFNRDDKGSKGTRNLENEFSKSSDVKEVQKKVTVDESTDISETLDATTPLMEKVAFDLYAILANENSNADIDGTTVTSIDEDTVTEVTEVDSTTDDELTTVDITLPTTTTTTTTTTPSTTTASTTTTTTTTTTETPLINGRKSPFGAGRNRFRLRPQASSTESSNEGAKEAAPVESHFKQNRFSRPSLPNRANRPTSAPVVEEEAAKEVAKPVSNAASIRGRTRNRFNLRTSSTTEATDENAVDTAVNTVSTTQRSSTVRLRPSFNLRTRGRPTPASSTATEKSESGTADQQSTDEKSEEKIDEKPVPTRPSRFNVGRPNRLLARSRTPALNNLKPQANSDSDIGPSGASGESDSTKSDDDTNGNEDGASTVSETSTPQTGLNRLRNRPRIQIAASTARTKAPVTINRKVNPLISRRKLGGSSTTQEPSSEEVEEGQSNSQDEQYDAKEGEDYENSKESKKDETTDVVETSSEQPRGLGLLGNRRRLQMRKPGTIVTN